MIDSPNFFQSLFKLFLLTQTKICFYEEQMFLMMIVCMQSTCLMHSVKNIMCLLGLTNVNNAMDRRKKMLKAIPTAISA